MLILNKESSLEYLRDAFENIERLVHGKCSWDSEKQPVINVKHQFPVVLTQQMSFYDVIDMNKWNSFQDKAVKEFIKIIKYHKGKVYGGIFVIPSNSTKHDLEFTLGFQIIIEDKK